MNIRAAFLATLGDRETVRSLLNARTKDEVAGPEGTSALIWSAYRNDVDMAELFLRAGVDVNAANSYGATALYGAAASADPTLTEKLLAAGGDANSHLLSGETP